MYQFLKIQNNIPTSYKKIILGYEPSLIGENTFFLSPIAIANAMQINYEIGTEEGVLALLCFYLAKNDSLDFEHFDLGYLSAESNIGEEEMQDLIDFIDQEKFCFIFTLDFIKHPKFSNLFSFIQILSSYRLCYFYPTLMQEHFSLPEYNGLMTRLCKGEDELLGSIQFATLAKIQEGDKIWVKNPHFSIQTSFKLDCSMRGTISLLKTPKEFDLYPYQKITIEKIQK